jgi:hypothetical protein
MSGEEQVIFWAVLWRVLEYQQVTLQSSAVKASEINMGTIERCITEF